MNDRYNNGINAKAHHTAILASVRDFFFDHWHLWLMMLGGILTGFTVIFPQFGFAEWVTLIPMFFSFYHLCQNHFVKGKRAYAYGFFAIFSYNLVIYHWFLCMYPMDFVGLTNEESVFVVILGWIGLSLLQALPGGLIFLLYNWLHRAQAFSASSIFKILFLPCMWVILEWVSTLGWTGVPMGRLCLGQIQYLPILQSASLFGPYFVSFLILLVNALLAFALCFSVKKLACCITTGAILFGSVTFGIARMEIRKQVTYKDEAAFSVAVIQGNLSVYESWDNSSYRLMKNVHADLTRKAVADGAQLVIWPETTFPYDLSESSDLTCFSSNLARECGVPIIIGALDSDEEGNDYNVLYYVDEKGNIRDETYIKRRLVPFGEYVPMGDLFSVLLPPLADMMALGAGLTAGEDAYCFETEWGSAGALICYDSIYEPLTRDSVLNGAEWMMIASNDSWFRNSAAVDLHQAQAQLRAIESGRYVASAVNTGISSLISAEGEILAFLDKDTDGYAIAKLAPRNDRTLYMSIGNLFVYLCMMWVIISFGVGIYKKRKTAKSDALSEVRSNDINEEPH